MKKTLYILLGVSCVLFSCNKNAHQVENTPVETIKAYISEAPAAKVVAVKAESGLDWNWQASDKILVSSTEKSSIFDIAAEFKPKAAGFVGKPVQGTAFDIQYPASDNLEEKSFLNQVQTGNNVLTHIDYFALLKGVNNYREFSFDGAWAAANGGSFKQGGVLHLALTLPASVTEVNSIIISAAAPFIHKSNEKDALTAEISISLQECTLGEAKKVDAYITTSWYDDALPAGTVLDFKVFAGEETWVSQITLTEANAIKAGYVNNLKIENAEAWKAGSKFAGGDGSEANPYQIGTAAQLGYVRDDLVAGEMRYYKLIADVDLTDVEWAPLNVDVNSDKQMSFSGEGYTISNLTVSADAYASFAGILNGTVKDVTFKDAVVSGKDNVAVVAGSMKAGTISGVIVTDAEVTSTNSNVGAVVGYAVAGSVETCLASGTVTGSTFVGGFVGLTDDASFTDCGFTGSVVGTRDGNIQGGAFAGRSAKASSFTGCTASEVALTAPKGVQIGGFIGRAEADATFTKCAVIGVQIVAKANVGGFIGVSVQKNSATGGIFQCAVDGGSLAASALSATQGAGGFAAYLDGIIARNCYSNIAIDNSGNFANVGGFLGYATNSYPVNIQYCYSANTFTYNPDAEDLAGIFGGTVKSADLSKVSILHSIGWTADENLWFWGGTDTAYDDIADCYYGAEETLGTQMQALNWDANIWDFTTGKLK